MELAGNIYSINPEVSGSFNNHASSKVAGAVAKAARPDPEKPDPSTSTAPFRIYNIGNSRPVDLIEYIEAIENSLGVKAIKEYLPLQPGDVPNTFADIEALKTNFN